MFDREAIARLSRTFGISMREVRAMTLADVDAMSSVIREERTQQRQMAQARQRMAAARKPRAR